MDAFDLLKADHKKVATLFDRLEAASGKEKLPIFNQIKTELELHTHIEEKIFYPALEKPRETHDLTLEAYEEHAVVKELLAELSGARAANEEWQARAKVLRENVEHHVDEEENELFDKAADALSDEEIEQLGDRMEAEKARKQGRSAPRQATKSAKQKGIIAKVAEFVGLGENPPTTRKAAKRTGKGKSRSKATRSEVRSTKRSSTAPKRVSKTSRSKKSSGTAKKASGGRSRTASKKK